MVRTRSSSQLLNPLKPMKRHDYIDQFKPEHLTVKKSEIPPKGYVDVARSGSLYYFVIKVKNPNKFDYTIERNGSVRVRGVSDGKTSRFSLPGPVDPRKISHTFLDDIFECVVKKASE